MSREDLRAAGEAEVARWEKAIADELLRLFDRQQAVVLARLQGTKARKHTRHWYPLVETPRALEVKAIIDPARWVKDAAEALAPLVARLFEAVYRRVSSQLDPTVPPAPAADDPRIRDAVQARLDRLAEGVEGAAGEVERYLQAEEDAGSTVPDMADGVRQIYTARKPSWADRISTLSAVGSINQAALFAASDRGSSAKQWLSQRDTSVRDTHVKADGQVRLLDERFRLGGFDGHERALLMFPGDPGPTVPIGEVINCRCLLLFSPPRAKKAAPSIDPFAELAWLTDGDLEAKARVRTAAGAAQYGQPIGSIIVPDPLNAPASSPRVVATISGSRVTDASADADVRKLIAKYAGPGAVPDPAKTSVLALRDRNDRVGAYVVWQNADGDRPAGTVLEVSVHPKLKGQRLGDQLVALAMAEDPRIQPRTRPATSAPAPRVARTPARPAAARPARGAVKDRTQPGDQPGTSGDFAADAARIDRLQKAYLRDRADTTSLFSRNGRWTATREAEQQAIIDHFLGAPGVKSDGKLLVLGGLPGAGKTTTINSAIGQAALGIDLSEYVVVNADEVKEQMLARGMVPDYPGLSAEESATMFHAESFEVAHSLMRQAAKRGLNFAYDTSLKTTGQVGFATGAAAASRTKYSTTLLFVDVPLPIAKQRARDRYLAGGRYMPLALIDGMRAHSTRRSSGPAENFDLVKKQADAWYVFDNAGTAPAITGQGGRRARP